MAIAISYTDFVKYGCPKCGCDSARGGNFMGNGTQEGTCRECGEVFVVLADGKTKSSIGYRTNKTDENGKAIFDFPELQQHPRKGIPWHEWIPADPRPENGGEYWKPRPIGYDLSGFVKSKAAGERLLEMVKEVLETDEPASWLDYRDFEPEWIQFKFQKKEFNVEKLRQMVLDNDGVITKEILIACKIQHNQENKNQQGENK